MKRILLLLLLVSSTTNAAPPVTYQFTDGTTIEAPQINANYQELADRIELLQNQIASMQNNAQKSIIGFTTALSTTNETGHFAKFSQLCYAEFVDSRICNTKEVRETVNPPLLGVGERAWVMPTNIIPVEVGSTAIKYDSISGLGTTGGNGSGCLSVDVNGAYDQFCNNNFGPNQYRVACCK
jgi:hypothetical protein